MDRVVNIDIHPQSFNAIAGHFKKQVYLTQEVRPTRCLELFLLFLLFSLTHLYFSSALGRSLTRMGRGSICTRTPVTFKSTSQPLRSRTYGATRMLELTLCRSRSTNRRFRFAYTLLSAFTTGQGIAGLKDIDNYGTSSSSIQRELSHP